LSLELVVDKEFYKLFSILQGYLFVFSTRN
jgi:hypothetical protein